MARLLKHHLSVYLSVGPSVRPSVHPFFHPSVGSKPVHFSRLTLFTVVLSAPHHQASLRVQAWDRHRYHFWFLWRGFGVCMKQKSRSECLPCRGLNLGPDSLMTANVTIRPAVLNMWSAAICLVVRKKLLKFILFKINIRKHKNFSNIFNLYHFNH